MASGQEYRALSLSAAVLGEVITAVEDFLDRVAWPH
jgi:hypothetical protein